MINSYIFDEIRKGLWDEQDVIKHCLLNKISYNVFMNQELLALAEKYCSGELNFVYCHSVAKHFHYWLQSVEFLHSSQRHFLEPAYSIVLMFMGIPPKSNPDFECEVREKLKNILNEVDETGSYPVNVHPIPRYLLDNSRPHDAFPLYGVLSILFPIIGLLLSILALIVSHSLLLIIIVPFIFWGGCLVGAICSLIAMLVYEGKESFYGFIGGIISILMAMLPLSFLGN